MSAVRPRGKVDVTAGGSIRAPDVRGDGRSVRRRVETVPAHAAACSSPVQAYEENRAAPAAVEIDPHRITTCQNLKIRAAKEQEIVLQE